MKRFQIKQANGQWVVIRATVLRETRFDITLQDELGTVFTKFHSNVLEIVEVRTCRSLFTQVSRKLYRSLIMPLTLDADEASLAEQMTGFLFWGLFGSTAVGFFFGG